MAGECILWWPPKPSAGPGRPGKGSGPSLWGPCCVCFGDAPSPNPHPWHSAAVTVHFACVSSPPWGTGPDPPACASGTGMSRLGHSPCFPRGSFLVLLLRECFRDLSWPATVGSATGEAGLLVTSIVPQTSFFWAMRITEVRAQRWPSWAHLSLPGLGPSAVASRTTVISPLAWVSSLPCLLPLAPLGQMSSR